MIRVIVSEDNSGLLRLRQALRDRNITHTSIRTIGSALSKVFYVTELDSDIDLAFLALVLGDTDFRKLEPTDFYYIICDDPAYQGYDYINTDADYWNN